MRGPENMELRFATRSAIIQTMENHRLFPET